MAINRTLAVLVAATLAAGLAAAPAQAAKIRPITAPGVGRVLIKEPTAAELAASRTLRLTHNQAKAKLAAEGIGVYSSGGCSSRSGSSCTSLDTILTAVIDDVITLKKRSGCTVLVTGGTETGHATGPYSHWNGYKADVNMNSCLDNWVRGHGSYVGSSRWSIDKAVYYYEGNHWDITSKP